MIVLLTRLRDDPDQHFHVSSDYSGSGGLGDIEVYVSEADAASNMHIGSFALATGNGQRATGNGQRNTANRFLTIHSSRNRFAG